MCHGQNLSSTSGDPEFVAQYFCEISASGVLYQMEDVQYERNTTEDNNGNVVFKCNHKSAGKWVVLGRHYSDRHHSFSQQISHTVTSFVTGLAG
jgi:hypothetical protein